MQPKSLNTEETETLSGALRELLAEARKDLERAQQMVDHGPGVAFSCSSLSRATSSGMVGSAGMGVESLQVVVSSGTRHGVRVEHPRAVDAPVDDAAAVAADERCSDSQGGEGE